MITKENVNDQQIKQGPYYIKTYWEIIWYLTCMYYKESASQNQVVVNILAYKL